MLARAIAKIVADTRLMNSHIMYLTKMRILIIGGTGLISAALTRQLIERGECVTVYNRGRAPADISGTAVHLTGDRYNPDAFIRDMRNAGEFECVIDMITYAPPDAASLIEAFTGHTPHLIVCSTIDVYAKPSSRYPITESEPYGGIGDYAIGKVACERMLIESGLPLTIIRPGHTYGRGGQHRGHVIHSFGGKGTAFLDRLQKGKRVIVHGDGSSFWTSCHLEDVARGFAGAVGNSKTIGKSYHVPGEEWLTWNEYHRQVAQAMKAPDPKLVHIPTDFLTRVAPEQARLAHENFQYHNIFDNSAAHTDLGFRYTTSFLDGMRDTIPWVEQTYGFDKSGDDTVYDRVLELWDSMGERMASELVRR